MFGTSVSTSNLLLLQNTFGNGHPVGILVGFLEHSCFWHVHIDRGNLKSQIGAIIGKRNSLHKHECAATVVGRTWYKCQIQYSEYSDFNELIVGRVDICCVLFEYSTMILFLIF